MKTVAGSFTQELNNELFDVVLYHNNQDSLNDIEQLKLTDNNIIEVFETDSMLLVVKRVK